jgi:DNA/RNA endonuclease G (NUC1)
MKSSALRRMLAILLALLAASPAYAARPRDCNPAEKAAGNAAIVALSGNPARVAAAVAANLPWGVPAPTAPTTNETQLVLADYVIRYDGDLRVPIWIAERIDSARLDPAVARTDCFRPDPRLGAAATATLADYAGSGFDRGHLAPFADQRYSVVAGNNSFVLSNMAPQIGAFNSGIWGALEDLTREWAARHGTLYVLSGSIFDRDGNGRRDPDSAASHVRSGRVGIPTHFFKIVAFPGAGGRIETLAFLMPHDATRPRGAAARRAYLTAHITDIATIERLTGVDFFPGAAGIHESTALW